MKTITVEMLVESGFGCTQVDAFRRLFPNGVTFESEEDAIAQCVAVADAFDWDLAAFQLLSPPALKSYDKSEDAADKAYEEATAPALKSYMEDVAAAFAVEFWRLEA